MKMNHRWAILVLLVALILGATAVKAWADARLPHAAD